RIFRLQMVGHDAAVEGLPETVCRDETEAARAAGTDCLGGPMPPVHDVVRAFRDLRISLTQRFGITVAEFGTHHPVPNEGWVANNEIGLRPRRRVRIHIPKDCSPRGFIGHFFAGRRVDAHRALIPLGTNGAARVPRRLFAIVGQERIAAFDVVEALDDGLWRKGGRAPGPEIPLQITDPEHEVRDDSGTRIQLQAEQLMRIDRHAGFGENELRFSEAFQYFDHFAFQALQVFESYIEKVAAAAGGVQDIEAAEIAAELVDGFAGSVHIS